MKKLVLSAIIAASPFFAHAAGGHGPAGCGLGTEVIFKQANEWHEHVLAATTNGTSGNQTFGMTSGTLGCESANGPLADARLFIDGNVEQLAADTAAGAGETLDALAEVIGIQQADKAHFQAHLQSNFSQIFSSAEVQSGEIYDALVTLLKQDETLSKYAA